MVINEAFQVVAMIEKLSSSWGDFRNYLKDKRKDMDMEALIGKLQIEDDNKRSDRRFMKAEMKANVMEHGSSSKNKKKPGKNSKMGHRAVDCRLPKRKRNIETMMMEYITREVDEIDLSTVVSEVNLVGSNPREWWIDTGATCHVCANGSMFTSFEPKANGVKLFMGNSAYSEIQWEGKIVLKMTSGKDLTLNNMFNKSLLAKFAWALGVDPDFRF
ncbi:uncharacterized protein LOC125418317 [Ziziphus jujuba]|uniref:Uncharacterized protein LOC125418317 n=1 Tax=Ziziphus jujuba TaxID=326968 RepID=A0ABM3I821_ZIZJJ|nr:uncharacterized protein LOC125418317 [Ziziphus jujuba]